jgi:hypothetical protein
MKNIVHTKIIIAVSVFLLGLVIFKLLQNQTIFNKTLGKFAITYMNTSEPGETIKTTVIIKTNNPYTTLEEPNFLNWDVQFYKYMSEHGYGKDNTWPGIGTYAFSPLFPLLWGLSHLPARFICIFNVILFVASLIMLSMLFLTKEDFNKTERLILFTLALTLPTVFSFYIPYSEATFMFTLTLAVWGLFRGKRWLFYTGMVLFALSRPSFLIFSAALIFTDLYFFIFNRKFKVFIKELGVKILPILFGAFLTFFIQYLYSGSFFKLFQVHDLFWGHYFKIPTTIKDWSTEGYGMNIFSICCVTLPASLFLFTYLGKYLKKGEKQSISLFSSESRNEYLFILAIVFFIGNVFFVLLSQGGNLNGIHRYIMVSPVFYIFFFILAKKLKTIRYTNLSTLFVCLFFLGFLLLIHGPYQHKISFLDGGYFLLFATMIYYIYYSKLKRNLSLALLPVLVLFNTVWLTYLFNHFLNNAFIIP